MYEIQDELYFWILGFVTWMLTGSFLDGLVIGLLSFVFVNKKS